MQEETRKKSPQIILANISYFSSMSSEISSVQRIRDLMLEAGCFNLRRNWINVDYVWHKAEMFDSFTTPMVAIIQEYRNTLKFNKFALVDKIHGPYGALPIFVLISQKLDPKIPFVIWKEFARPVLGQSDFLGEISNSDRFLLIHDVINYGAACVKFWNDLKMLRAEKQMRFSVTGILAIVDCMRGGTDFIKQNTGIEPIVLLSLSDFRKTVQIRS